VSKELKTLLTALYVLIDDHVVPSRVGRGRWPQLSDSELITLAVAQVMLGYHRERRWIRHLHSCPEWRAMFPYLLSQPGYPKRWKNAQPLLCKAILVLAACCPFWFDDLWMIDATPVPCGMSRETVKRSDLAGHVGYGYCATHSRWYWCLKLSLVCSGDGMPIMWCLANPTLGERQVLTVPSAPDWPDQTGPSRPDDRQPGRFVPGCHRALAVLRWRAFGNVVRCLVAVLADTYGPIKVVHSKAILSCSTRRMASSQLARTKAPRSTRVAPRHLWSLTSRSW